MTKQSFDKRKELGFFNKTDVDIVKDTVQGLLDNLFVPCDDERKLHDIDYVSDPIKVERHNLGEDAINWGDLVVAEVKKFADGQFLVTIEEAAPNCINLIKYVEKFMTQWGWNVRVQTEW